ncbi:MAG TPA: winged helix-turn-helix domain-containing protein [Myxococcales bacterium]|nr:winged helix-turn-helix domain-containing protein [Myxococcales bacterium]
MRHARPGAPGAGETGSAGDQVIAFGPYRLDRSRGRLLCGSDNVPLRCKTFAVLEYLAMRPGRLVPKNELLDVLWPATHVTPSVLAGCIRELRRALGDDVRAPRFVETAHRRGYRFIATEPVVVTPSRPAPSEGVSQALRVDRDTALALLARRFADAVVGIMKREWPGQGGSHRDRVKARRGRVR